MNNEIKDWVRVPREPSAEMLDAAIDAHIGFDGEDEVDAVWAAMLAAAPTPPAEAIVTALSAQPRPASAEDRFEQFVQAEIARSPEPLRELGEYLGRVLDEDQFPAANRLLLQLATLTPKAIAPVGVEALVAKWRAEAYPINGTKAMRLAECADELEAALAQQPAAVGVGETVNPADTDGGIDGDWYCERHPWALQGHDGCDGAGLPACARIDMLCHIIRMRDQELRERDQQYGFLADRALAQHPAAVDEEAATASLRMMVGAATPVSVEIDPRGYTWSEVYLDQALPAARAALAQPQGEK